MAEIGFFKHARDIVVYEPGDALFRAGDPGDTMFAVIEGEVDLVVDDRRLDTVGPGGIVGEMALVDAAPRSATAVARTPARVAKVTKREFTFLVQEHPTFALQVMAVLAERLRRANQDHA
ncbi:MAG: Crp/Fnr family transcriptional regulator [Acidimicrobiia bacterium]